MFGVLSVTFQDWLANCTLCICFIVVIGIIMSKTHLVQFKASVFLLYLSVFLYPVLVSGQINENIRGVSIAEDTLPPHESAILEVRSINKGVKYPSLSYDDMIYWQTEINSASGLSATSSGLVIFVHTRENASEVELLLFRGFYYWSHDPVSGIGAWIQISSRKAVYPPGAIISYSGKVAGLFDASGKGLAGTRMEGWHICNGQAGTPDLRARFITSFSDELVGTNEANVVDGYTLDDFGASQSALYDPANGQQQNVNEKDFRFITKEEIPAHSHLAESESINDYIGTSEAVAGSFARHKHPIEIRQPTHTHKYAYTRREYRGDGWSNKRNAYLGADKPQVTLRSWRRWKNVDTRENNADWQTDPQQRTSTSYDEVKADVSKSVIQLPSLTKENISNNNESDCLVDHKYSRQKAIDLRPSYYVVLYLIKL